MITFKSNVIGFYCYDSSVISKELCIFLYIICRAAAAAAAATAAALHFNSTHQVNLREDDD